MFPSGRNVKFRRSREFGPTAPRVPAHTLSRGLADNLHAGRPPVFPAGMHTDRENASPVHGPGKPSASDNALLPRRDSEAPYQDIRRVKHIVPWIVAVAMFMEQLDATIVNVAVPTMARDLDVLPLSLKAVLTSYTLSLAVFIPISGWMADRFGTRRVFSLAVTMFLTGSILCGASINVPMLVVSRIVQGMGGAMMMPVGRVVLVRTFPRSEIITAMNYVVIPALIGPLLGPVTGGLIIHWMPWRVIFLLNVPIGLAGLYLVWRYMPDFRNPRIGPVDALGFVVFGSGIALLSYVLEVFGQHKLGSAPLSLLTAGGFALLATYVWHARRARHPVLRLDLFRVRTFRISVVGGFVTRLGVGGMPFLLPLLYQIGLGYEPWQAGLLTVPQAFAAMTMKLFTGRLLRRFGHRRVLLLNTICFGGNIILFTLVNMETPVWTILLLSFTQGFFASLQYTSMNSLIYADVSDLDASHASSIASTSQQMSFSFGIAFASLVAGWFLRESSQTDMVSMMSAVHQTCVVIGTVVIVAALAFLALGPSDGNGVSGFHPRRRRTKADATHA